MNPADLAAIRPWSYHPTFRGNLGRIIAERKIESPGLLATVAGLDLLFGHRPEPLAVGGLVIAAHQPAVRAVDSVRESNAACFDRDFRARFFPGGDVPPSIALDHPQWGRNDAVVLRVPTLALIEAAVITPRFLRRGSAPVRGAYLPANEFSWSPEEVLEIGFPAEAQLPETGVEWAPVSKLQFVTLRHS